MSTKTFETNLCEFVRHLDDEEIQWLLEAPTLVPELMGLTDHLPACAECGDRVGRILLGDSQSGLTSATRPLPSDPTIPHTVPRNVAASSFSKLSVIDLARHDKVFGSLVNVDIVPRVGTTQLSAAASHTAPAPMSMQRRFTLSWKQGEHEWRIEGLSAGKNQELVLSSTDGVQPSFITWNNSATGDSERLELTSSNDGRILIRGIPLSKALRRAEALRDTVDETKRRGMLPVVHMAGEAL